MSSKTGIPPSVQLDVPHVYDGCGKLCILGSLAMLMEAYNKNITYEQVVLVSGAGSGYGCSLFSGGLPPQKLAFTTIRRMGFRPYMAVGPNPNPALVFAFLRQLPPEKIIHTEDPVQAEETVWKQLGEKRPVMVHVDEYYLSSEDRPEIRRNKHNPHFMVITGYDEESYIMNDPGFYGKFASGTKVNRAQLIQAWEEGGSFGEKFGPYFILWLKPTGLAPSDEILMNYLKRDSKSSPFYLRTMASRLKRGVGFYEWNRIKDTTTELYGRRVLSNYLERKGLKQASELYKQSADLFEKASRCTGYMELSDLFYKIADQEEKASKALCSDL